MTQVRGQIFPIYAAVRGGPGRAARGLTLTELLVALALLSALAAGVFPAAQALLARGATQDAQRSLQTSWQMAQAMALAQQQPVLWELSNESGAVRLAIYRDAHLPPDWSLTLNNLHVRARPQGAASFAKQVAVPVYGHGLTDPVELEVTGADQTFTVILGGASQGGTP